MMQIEQDLKVWNQVLDLITSGFCDIEDDEQS